MVLGDYELSERRCVVLQITRCMKGVENDLVLLLGVGKLFRV